VCALGAKERGEKLLRREWRGDFKRKTSKNWMNKEELKILVFNEP